MLVGFLVKGMRYPSNYKKILKKGIELDPSSFSKIIEIFGSDGTLYEKILDIQKKSQSKVLHDLKHLVSALQRTVENSHVKSATENLDPSSDDINVLKETAKDVYNILGAIKVQFELSDFVLAPETADFNDQEEIDLYRIFEKYSIMYQAISERDEKNIEMIRQNYFVRASRLLPKVFVLLPPILIQNAIKHSMDGTNIEVKVEIIGGKVKMCVRSYGSIIPTEIRTEIWKQGVQYIHENDTRKGGGGFGLYLAKTIADKCGFSISYDGDFVELLSGVPVGWNTFTCCDP